MKVAHAEELYRLWAGFSETFLWNKKSFLTTEEIACGHSWAYLTFENVIERALIRDIAVTHKVDDIVYASSYTFGGIRLSEVAINCQRGEARRV